MRATGTDAEGPPSAAFGGAEERACGGPAEERAGAGREGGKADRNAERRGQEADAVLRDVRALGIVLRRRVAATTNRADDRASGASAALCIMAKAEAARAFRESRTRDVLTGFGAMTKQERRVLDQILETGSITIQEGKRDRAMA